VAARRTTTGATYFASATEWRAWLAANHESATELLVGFHKTRTGRPTLTWSESVDQSLCFGGIDGVRRSVDEARYAIRFTPRKPSSGWSQINLEKVKALEGAGLMHDAGRRAHAARGERPRYSYEQRKEARLTKADIETFRGNATAWEYFSSQPPGYRHVATFWVVSAKKRETQMRRMARLIADSAARRRIDAVTSPAKRAAR
jgi:uncharacterized protein YdeI (YjbR/CyaY-like superfamily)